MTKPTQQDLLKIINEYNLEKCDGCKVKPECLGYYVDCPQHIENISVKDIWIKCGNSDNAVLFDIDGDGELEYVIDIDWDNKIVTVIKTAEPKDGEIAPADLICYKLVPKSSPIPLPSLPLPGLPNLSDVLKGILSNPTTLLAVGIAAFLLFGERGLVLVIALLIVGIMNGWVKL
jgi:hypothetical protein